MTFPVKICSLLFAIAVTSISCSNRESELTAAYDFENEAFGDLRTNKLRYGYSGLIVDTLARNGNFSVRFELRKDDDLNWIEGSRAELKDNLNVPLNQEIWYGISLYIPSDFPELERNCVVMQWHGEHDKREASRSPVLALRVVGDTLYINSRSSKKRIQTNNRGPQVEHFRMQNFPRDEWIDFVVKAVWSHKSKGTLNMWLNGNQIISYEGPIGYNDRKGPYFKFGLYKHSGDEPLVIYHDEYRRGNSEEEVNPAFFTTP